MKILHKDTRTWSGYGRREVPTTNQDQLPQLSNHTNTTKMMMLTKATWPSLFHFGQFIGCSGPTKSTMSVISVPPLSLSGDISETEAPCSTSVSWEVISSWMIEDSEDCWAFPCWYLPSLGTRPTNGCTISNWMSTGVRKALVRHDLILAPHNHFPPRNVRTNSTKISIKLKR